MYGVVKIGGHQYKVQAGDVLDVEKLCSESGAKIELTDVLFIGGENPQVGKPNVEGAKVTAQVIKTDRDRKQVVYKRKPGLYKRKKGHRQPYTALVVTEVADGQGNADKIDSDSKAAKKYLN